jgi:hypothetical protein
MSGRVRAGDRAYQDLTPALPATAELVPDARERARAVVIRRVPNEDDRRTILAALGIADEPDEAADR